LNEEYKNFNGNAIAVSFDLKKDYAPISLNSSLNEYIDTYKAIVDDIAISSFEKEARIKLDDKNYEMSKNIDIVPILHNSEQKYFYIADVRLIPKMKKIFMCLIK
jgi:hypothetical protein